MQDNEQRRGELIAKLYERVCLSLMEKRRLRLTMRDPIKKRIELILDPHYVNMDWEGDLFIIAKRGQGPAPYGERNGWNTVFLKEIYKYSLLPDRFDPDNSLFDHIEQYGYTFIRPSPYELYVEFP